MPDNEHKEMGCFVDKDSNPDFEELLSSKLIDVNQCIQMAF
jgi:hypothetical protein